MNHAPPPEFHDLITQFGLEFESDDLEKLDRYLALLLETNTKFNLTSITDPSDAWIRHIGDSLSLVAYLASYEVMNVIDIGAGGGLPGLPLAIVLPEITFTLVESTGKKAAFLSETIEALGLENVNVINDRAENLGQDHKQHREHYDVAIARAVGRLPVLLELTVPLVKLEGHVLAIKGAQAPQEVEEAKPALHLLHSELIDLVKGETGSIVVIQKHRKTPRLYPRRPGEPKRVPLGVSRD